MTYIASRMFTEITSDYECLISWEFILNQIVKEYYAGLAQK